MRWLFQGFQPRRPVRSFLDLEVYQKSLNLSVLVMKHMVFPVELGPRGKDKPACAIPPIETDKLGRELGVESEELNLESGKEIVCRALLKNMLPCILGIPHAIAELHSLRFYDTALAVQIPEGAMVNCNKAIAYIEQARDLLGVGIDPKLCEDVIRQYGERRRKLFHLETSWKKFNTPPKKKK